MRLAEIGAAGRALGVVVGPSAVADAVVATAGISLVRGLRGRRPAGSARGVVALTGLYSPAGGHACSRVAGRRSARGSSTACC